MAAEDLLFWIIKINGANVKNLTHRKMVEMFLNANNEDNRLIIELQSQKSDKNDLPGAAEIISNVESSIDNIAEMAIASDITKTPGHQIDNFTSANTAISTKKTISNESDNNAVKINIEFIHADILQTPKPNQSPVELVLRLRAIIDNDDAMPLCCQTNSTRLPLAVPPATVINKSTCIGKSTQTDISTIMQQVPQQRLPKQELHTAQQTDLSQQHQQQEAERKHQTQQHQAHNQHFQLQQQHNDRLIEEEHTFFEQCLGPDIDVEEITLRKSASNERLGLTVCYSSEGAEHVTNPTTISLSSTTTPVSAVPLTTTNSTTKSLIDTLTFAVIAVHSPITANASLTDVDHHSQNVTASNNTTMPCNTFSDVYISHIQPGSIAANDGRLRQGDQILQINGKEVHSKEETEALIAENCNAVTLLVSRYIFADDDDFNDPSVAELDIDIEDDVDDDEDDDDVVDEVVVDVVDDEEDDDDDDDAFYDQNLGYENCVVNTVPSFLFEQTQPIVGMTDDLPLTTGKMETTYIATKQTHAKRVRPIKVVVLGNDVAPKKPIQQTAEELTLAASGTHSNNINNRSKMKDMTMKLAQMRTQATVSASCTGNVNSSSSTSSTTSSDHAHQNQRHQHIDYDAEHIYETIPEYSEESEPFYCSPYESSISLAAVSSSTAAGGHLFNEADQQQKQRVAQWLGLKQPNNTTKRQIVASNEFVTLRTGAAINGGLSGRNVLSLQRWNGAPALSAMSNSKHQEQQRIIDNSLIPTLLYQGTDSSCSSNGMGVIGVSNATTATAAATTTITTTSTMASGITSTCSVTLTPPIGGGSDELADNSSSAYNTGGSNNSSGTPVLLVLNSTQIDCTCGGKLATTQQRLQSPKEKTTSPKTSAFPLGRVEIGGRPIEITSKSTENQKQSQQKQMVQQNNVGSGVNGNDQRLHTGRQSISDKYDHKNQRMIANHNNHNRADVYGQKIQQTKREDETPMVWKVKRRPDGTRYIVRRPAQRTGSASIDASQRLITREPRNTLRLHNQQPANHEMFNTTEEETISEVKIGRYWTKDERKKHLERSRQRKQQHIAEANSNTAAVRMNHRHGPDMPSLCRRRQRSTARSGEQRDNENGTDAICNTKRILQQQQQQQYYQLHFKSATTVTPPIQQQQSAITQPTLTPTKDANCITLDSMKLSMASHHRISCGSLQGHSPGVAENIMEATAASTSTAGVLHMPLLNENVITNNAAKSQASLRYANEQTTDKCNNLLQTSVSTA